MARAGNGHAADDHEHHHPDFETWSWSRAAPVSGAGLVQAPQGAADGIVRAKGLLYLQQDAANRYVMQLVGRRWSITADRPWKDDERRDSRLVVIGLPGSRFVRPDELEATLQRLATT